jgi:hypothetical protein
MMGSLYFFGDDVYSAADGLFVAGESGDQIDNILRWGHGFCVLSL